MDTFTNELFVPNTIMYMTAQHQMMMHQQMMLDYGTNLKPRQIYHPNNFIAPGIIYKERKEYNYTGNTFGTIPEEKPMFDDREIIDVIHNEILCYIKVDVIDENSIVLKCEVKEGYMYEEDVREIIHNQILTALMNNYTNISAAIGQNDEIAGWILGELGFEIT